MKRLNSYCSDSSVGSSAVVSVFASDGGFEWALCFPCLCLRPSTLTLAKLIISSRTKINQIFISLNWTLLYYIKFNTISIVDSTREKNYFLWTQVYLTNNKKKTELHSIISAYLYSSRTPGDLENICQSMHTIFLNIFFKFVRSLCKHISCEYYKMNLSMHPVYTLFPGHGS